MNLTKRGLLVVFFPIFFQLVLAVILITQMNAAQVQVERQAEIEESIALCNLLIRDLENASLIAGLSQEKTAPADYIALEEKLAGFDLRAATLAQRFVRDNDVEQAKNLLTVTNDISASTRLFAHKAAQYARLGANLSQDQAHALIAKVGSGARELRKIIDVEARALNEQRAKIRVRSHVLLKATVIIAILGVVLSSAVALVSIQRILSSLRNLNENIKRFARGEVLIVGPLAGDELSDLELTLRETAQVTEAAISRETALIENSAALVCALDARGNFLKVNLFAKRLLGYNPEELTGLNIAELAVDGLVATQAVEAACRKEGAATFAVTMKTKQNESLETEWSTFWSREDNSLFCVVTNITERHNIERLKEDFIDMVTHDLRSPLMSIVSGIAMLTQKQREQKGDISKAAREELVNAEITTMSLISLVNDFLDYEKLQAGKMELKIAPCEMLEILRLAMHKVEEQAAMRSIRIKLNHSARKSRKVVTDSDRLVQLLTNLLSSSLERSSANSTIEVSVVLENQRLEVTIIDQYENQSQSTGGSNLPFIVAKELAKVLGGELTSKVEPDNGCFTTFVCPQPLA